MSVHDDEVSGYDREPVPAPSLSAAEAARVAAFGLHDETVAEFKERTLGLLRVQEDLSRGEAARIRSHYDEAGPGAPGMADVIRQEARAGAFAAAVEIVEGLAL